MSTCQTCHNKGIIQHRHEHGPYCYIETYHGDKLICTTQYDEEKCPECYFNKLFKEYLMLRQEINMNLKTNYKIEKQCNNLTQQNRCLHDSCTMCNGTGIKKDGSACVHMLSCPCKKCSPVRL